MSEEFWGKPIFVYTRAQAIEDGVLVEMPTEKLREAGLIFPVAMTSESFARCVEWTDIDTQQAGEPQDVSARIWDVLWMLRQSIKGAIGKRVSEQEYHYPVIVLGDHEHDGKYTRKEVTLKAICGPGDNAEPVITVMFPWED
jgi:hypothetical protein